MSDHVCRVVEWGDHLNDEGRECGKPAPYRNRAKWGDTWAYSVTFPVCAEHRFGEFFVDEMGPVFRNG